VCVCVCILLSVFLSVQLSVYCPIFLGLWGLCEHERIKYGHETRGTQNQEWLCWRGPATIYPIRPDPNLLSVCVSPLIFVRRLMRSPLYLCVCTFFLNFFFFYAVRVVSRESRRFFFSQNFLFLHRFISVWIVQQQSLYCYRGWVIHYSLSAWRLDLLSYYIPANRRRGKWWVELVNFECLYCSFRGTSIFVLQ
jgi:hypothetical protein